MWQKKYGGEGGGGGGVIRQAGRKVGGYQAGRKGSSVVWQVFELHDEGKHAMKLTSCSMRATCTAPL
jgi:hypothetical protein